MTISPSILYRHAPSMSWGERSALLRKEFDARFSSGPSVWCSAPGRTELGGNHTDHNRGRVLAAAVQVDALGAAAANGTDTVTLRSIGYEEPFVVCLDTLTVRAGEAGTSHALIRGVLFRLHELGYSIGGFNAVVQSGVAVGSGLSSSAAFEVLIGSLVNWLFNAGAIPPNVLATTGQYAENRYFGKPCGLMDQLASATGGTSHIDFADPAAPVIEQVVLDPDSEGFSLCVVQTGGSHADLTDDYAAIPGEMRAVAGLFGAAECREVTREQLIADAKKVRSAAGDRAFLRALHFVDENERVLQQVGALRDGDFAAFLDLVNTSGRSSAMLLQNCWAPAHTREQGLSVALAVTDDFLRRAGGGACRVHGGGFAGTIQAYVPAGSMEQYVRDMEPLFGPGCVLPLSVRPFGAVLLEQEGDRIV